MNKRNIDYKKFWMEKPFSAGTRPCDLMLTLDPKAPWGFGKFLGEAICNLTDGITSHAMTKGNEGDIIEAISGGVTKTYIVDQVKSNNCIMVFRYTGLIDENKSNILSYLYGSVGRRYDTTGILHFIFKGINPDKRDNFCSENASEAFLTQNIKISDKSPQDTAPQTIMDFMYLNGAFDGKGLWKLVDWQNYNMDEVRAFLKIKHGR